MFRFTVTTSRQTNLFTNLKLYIFYTLLFFLAKWPLSCSCYLKPTAITEWCITLWSVMEVLKGYCRSSLCCPCLLIDAVASCPCVTVPTNVVYKLLTAHYRFDTCTKAEEQCDFICQQSEVSFTFCVCVTLFYVQLVPNHRTGFCSVEMSMSIFNLSITISR